MLTGRPAGDGPRILVVVAHPDDEIAFAGTVHQTATALGGTWDAVVVTNGEGGFKYATLAEEIYGAPLTVEEVGRARLPAIRSREMLESCGILGAHSVRFLDQRDHRYTQDVEEVLGPGAEVWDLEAVAASLDRVLEEGNYDFVLTLPPRESTHAHHKAASILAVEAARRLPPERQPVVLAGTTGTTDGAAPLGPTELPGYPATRIDPEPVGLFDRRRTFGHRARLDFRILANWAIAAHKSQGTMQLYANQGDYEVYFLYEPAPPAARARCDALFGDLAATAFPEREYDASAGTNAGPR